MTTLSILFAVVPALILFLYGIEQFSKEIQRVAGEKFRDILSKATNKPVAGALIGAIVTAIVQSSSATTVIAVGLVNAGVISFTQSLGVVIGANVGTTLTAQLVAFKLTAFAPVFIVAGFFIGLFGRNYKYLGKPIFYFGLVFLALNLVSLGLAPIKTDPSVIELFASLDTVFLSILVGFIFTALVQSSSVTTGLVVVLAQEGLLTLPQAVPIILGANIGTSTTALFASSQMNLYAKRSAFANAMFNIGGVLIFLPFLSLFNKLVLSFGTAPAQSVANAHLIFNVTVAAIFLMLINPFKKLVEFVVKGDEEEILFKTKYLDIAKPSVDSIEKELQYNVDITLKMFDKIIESLYNSTNEQTLQLILKYESLNDFLDKKIEYALLVLSKKKLSKREVDKIAILVQVSIDIEQLGDIFKDFNYVHTENKSLASKTHNLFSKDYSQIRSILADIRQDMPNIGAKNAKLILKQIKQEKNQIRAHFKLHLKEVQLADGLSSVYIKHSSLLENTLDKMTDFVFLLREYEKLKKKHSSNAIN